MIFIKNPVRGQVKTRLAKDIGDDLALEYYHKLLHITRQQAKYTEADRWLWYSQHVVKNDDWPETAFLKKTQQGRDLGSRMKYAFAEAFAAGYEQVVIIGSDCPGISAHIIHRAFALLKTADVVLGPANDGGYYLLGMKSMQPLFSGIPWSTSEVYRQTCEKIWEASLQFAELPELTDLDTIEDLKNLPQL